MTHALAYHSVEDLHRKHLILYPVLRVYCETLPLDEVVRPRTLTLLARYRLELVLAVRPWDLEALPGVARALADAGIALSIWPMLDDEAGRWASVHNAPVFDRLVQATCDSLVTRAPEHARPRDVLFDLEPPFAKARSLVALGDPQRETHLRGPDGIGRLLGGLRRTARLDAAAAVLAGTVRSVHDRGLSTSMAVWPMVALDPPGAEGWQSLLGTPVDGLDAGHVSVMMYTSMLEGWSRGGLRRRDVVALLAAATERAVRRWNGRAGISLGCVGAGAFEDEPVYRDPSELAEDATIARAAGCSRLSLFDLGGVLSRSPAEAWLEAFVDPAPSPPREPRKGMTTRVRAVRTLARAATWMLGRPSSMLTRR
jgi:hypothetical protein